MVETKTNLEMALEHLRIAISRGEVSEAYDARMAELADEIEDAIKDSVTEDE